MVAKGNVKGSLKLEEGHKNKGYHATGEERRTKAASSHYKNNGYTMITHWSARHWESRCLYPHDVIYLTRCYHPHLTDEAQKGYTAYPQPYPWAVVEVEGDPTTMPLRFHGTVQLFGAESDCICLLGSAEHLVLCLLLICYYYSLLFMARFLPLQVSSLISWCHNSCFRCPKIYFFTFKLWKLQSTLL